MHAIETSERRKNTRIPIDYKITVEASHHEIFGSILNVSTGGLQILTLEHVPADREIQMTIFLPDWLAGMYGKTLSVFGTWRWSRPYKKSSDNAFFIAGFEFSQTSLPAETMLFIEHVMLGVPDQIVGRPH
jgi:hypothetical protein